MLLVALDMINDHIGFNKNVEANQQIPPLIFKTLCFPLQLYFLREIVVVTKTLLLSCPTLWLIQSNLIPLSFELYLTISFPMSCPSYFYRNRSTKDQITIVSNQSLVDINIKNA